MRRQRLPHAQGRGEVRHPLRNQERELLRSVERAVRYEIRRHAAILERGEKVTQETRHWHEDTRETSSGRPKSDADDYRYFPEPDLVPVVTNSEWIERLRAELPEPPAERRRRLKGEWGYSDEEFRDVVNAGALDVIEETVAAGATAAAARKWWMGEIARRAKQAEVELTSLGVEPATVVALEALIGEGKINDKIARQVLEFVLAGEGTPAEIVEARGLAVVSDDGALTAAVQEALAAMPDVADKIRAGKVQAAGAIVGQVMKATRGQADAARVRELILAECGVEGCFSADSALTKEALSPEVGGGASFVLSCAERLLPYGSAWKSWVAWLPLGKAVIVLVPTGTRPRFASGTLMSLSDDTAFSRWGTVRVRPRFPEAPSGCHTGALRSEARRVRSTRVTGALRRRGGNMRRPDPAY